jgi:PEP-CTERM motif
MRKSLWIIPIVLVLLAIAAPIAHADSFEPFFSTTGCVGVCALPTASDVVFPAPTTMDVTFDAASAAVSIPSGDESTDAYVWYASAVGSSLNFLLTDTVGPGIPDGCQGYAGCGTLGFAPVTIPTSTPEPGSLVLVGTGLLGLLVLMARSKRTTTSPTC